MFFLNNVSEKEETAPRLIIVTRDSEAPFEQYDDWFGTDMYLSSGFTIA
jgi:hypothetical protein